MSLVSTLQEVTEQRDALLKEREAAQGQLASAQAEIDGLKKEVASMAAQVQEKSAQMAQAVEAHAATKETHQRLEKEIDGLKQALANPAFAAAAATGSEKAVAEGGAVQEAIEEKTPQQAKSEYKQIQGARARAEFRKQYAKQLGLE